jgi:6-phosphogluconolactonase
MFRNSSLAVLAAVALTACSGGMDSTSPPTSQIADVQAGGPSLSRSGGGGVGGVGGAVFTLSNAAGANAVLSFTRAANGTLSPAGSFATGGSGTGAGLGSQGAVVLSDDGRFLFAVNAASNSISSFSVNGSSLSLIGTESSGGTTPISITVHGRNLYVLNGGGSGSIVGFIVSGSGTVRMLPGSARRLSSSNAGPAQIGFDHTGNWLVVTEKNTNLIDTYFVGALGYALGPVVNKSEGQTPFGFAFDPNGLLVVSEAAGGAVDASTASSYVIGLLGRLHTVSAAVPTKQTAACWVAVTNDSRFAYMTNTGSASITGFETRIGRLHPLNADGRTGETGLTPIDAAMSRGSQYLYALEADAHGISAFSVDRSNGSLTKLSSASGLPAGAVGLAAR